MTKKQIGQAILFCCAIPFVAFVFISIGIYVFTGYAVTDIVERIGCSIIFCLAIALSIGVIEDVK